MHAGIGAKPPMTLNRISIYIKIDGWITFYLYLKRGPTLSIGCIPARRIQFLNTKLQYKLSMVVFYHRLLRYIYIIHIILTITAAINKKNYIIYFVGLNPMK